MLSRDIAVDSVILAVWCTLAAQRNCAGSETISSVRIRLYSPYARAQKGDQDEYADDDKNDE